MNSYFKGKKITLMGLGLLGRGVGDAKFLTSQGAELTVTDLKTREQLAESIEQLKKFKNISYTLGGHNLNDFRGKDMIIKAAGVPLDSPYIAEARKNGIPVEMSTALLVHLLHEQNVDFKTVGVTGTRGKSTVVQLIYEILKAGEHSTYLAGNIKGVATLPLLEKVRNGDILVLELDSWQLQGFGEHKMSPDIAIFTNFYGDHLDYYENFNNYFRDKAVIFQFQQKGDTFITLEKTLEVIREYSEKLSITVPKHPLVADVGDIPADWDIKIPGQHNRENITLAVAAARVLKISEDIIKKAVEGFRGVHGRLEFMKEINGVKWYNDNVASTPEATLAALDALGEEKNIVLIMGGTDKNLNMSELVSVLPKYCKAVVLLNETGTERIKDDIYKLDGMEVVESNSPHEMVEKAASLAQKGDIVLFSPAFPSFGRHYKNVYDRGEQFVANVEKL